MFGLVLLWLLLAAIIFWSSPPCLNDRKETIVTGAEAMAVAAFLMALTVAMAAAVFLEPAPKPSPASAVKAPGKPFNYWEGREEYWPGKPVKK